MADSPPPQPHIPLPAVDAQTDNEHTWSNVELCLAAMQQTRHRNLVGGSPALTHVPIIDLDDVDFNPQQYQYQNPDHQYPCPDQHQYSYEQPVQLAQTPPLNVRPGLYSRKSIGHRASRRLDELFAISRMGNSLSYVHRPMRIPPSAFRIIDEGQARLEMLHPKEERRERFRRVKWVATRDSWPTLASVVVDENLLG